MMSGFDEEFEPLFDYTRVKHADVVCLDDDELDDYPLPSSKRKKTSNSTVEIIDVDVKDTQVLNSEKKDDEDWLPPPPKVSCNANTIGENSTIKELRLKKQELASFAQSAQDVLRAVEESVKKELHKQSFSEAIVDEASKPHDDRPSKPHNDRAKIIICIRDKDASRQFRIYSDDKFERLFKLYADKVKLDQQNLVFCFDGEKVGLEATPEALGMEDEDIIEVHVKPR